MSPDFPQFGCGKHWPLEVETAFICSNRLLLASGTEECGSLCLNDPLDLGFTAIATSISSLLINTMLVLVTAVLIQSIPVGAIIQSRPLIADRLIQDVMCGLIQFRDLLRGQSRSAAKWADAGAMQDLTGVKVADSRDQ